MKWLDLPPIWLVGGLVLTYWLGRFFPALLVNDVAFLTVAGGCFLAIGVGLMGAAVIQMRRFKTTVIPHLQADALVTSGIFAHTRNPIYLGDLFVLGGFMMYTGAWFAVPVFMAFYLILKHRFVLPEEARLLAKFGSEFELYCRKTRRWI